MTVPSHTLTLREPGTWSGEPYGFNVKETSPPIPEKKQPALGVIVPCAGAAQCVFPNGQIPQSAWAAPVTNWCSDESLTAAHLCVCGLLRHDPHAASGDQMVGWGSGPLQHTDASHRREVEPSRRWSAAEGLGAGSVAEADQSVSVRPTS